MNNLKCLLAVFFLCVSFVRCGDENEKKTILPIDNLDKSIVDFFGSALPVIKSDCFFSSVDGDVCCIVNSKEELQAIYSCEKELPEINFSLYTLVIGQKKMPNSYYSITEQSIDETDVLTLNLHVQLPDEHWPAFSQMYYWGIYPKLYKKKIDVNVF